MVFDMRDRFCNNFIEMAMEIERIYGVPLIFYDEHEIVGYHCPHCNEPIYFVDWIDEYLGGQDMDMCPICEEDLEVD